MKFKLNLSPNFSNKIRAKTQIKYIVFHYTGMQSGIESINRLTDIKSKVSCHYYIGRTGEILQMVKDNRTAWHAGKCKWNNLKDLNDKSIGIEIENKGHKFGYQNFTNLQIRSLIHLCKKLRNKFKIKDENFLGHSDIAPLRKIDPGEKFPWKKLSKFKIGIWYDLKSKKSLSTGNSDFRTIFFRNLHKIGYRYFSKNIRKQNDIKIIKAFQRRYLPHKVNGKIDEKLIKISLILAEKSKIA